MSSWHAQNSLLDASAWTFNVHVIIALSVVLHMIR